MKIKDLLFWGTFELMAFDSARLDAELLLAHLLGKDRSYLIAHDDHELGFWERRKYEKLIAKRKKGMPIAYLLGRKEFYGLDFEVNQHCLIPRPDTEVLAEALINYVQGDQLLLDVGTGSGCIPITVIKHVPHLEAVAVDISPQAVKVAEANAHRHSVNSRMVFYVSDLLKNVDPGLFEGWETVVSANLPYVPKGYEVNIETTFEPQVALYGGGDGLDIYRRLIEELTFIKPKAMFFECFEFQTAILAGYLPDYKLRQVKDMTGRAKMMMLERR